MLRLLALALLLPSFQDPDPAVALVAKLRLDNPAEREDAAARLKSLGTKALPELTKAAKDADPEVATRAGFIIRAINIRLQFTPRLLKSRPGIEDRLAAGDDSTWTQELIEIEDGRFYREDLEPLVEPALRGARTSAEKTAICAAAAMRELRFSIGPLKPHLKDPDKEVRRAALMLATRVKDRSVIPDILPLLHDPDDEDRPLAIDILEGLPAADSTPVFQALLKDKDPRVRVSGISGLWSFEANRKPGSLDAFLKDEDAGIRAAAFSAHVHHQVSLGVSDWLALATDPASEVRNRVWNDLDSVPDRWADMTPLLQSPNVDIRRECMDFLTLNDPSLFAPVLEIAVRDPDLFIRRRAFSTLLKLKDPSRLPLAIAGLGDADAAVRTAAVAAVRVLGTPESAKELLARLKDTSPDVRAEAAEALVDLAGQAYMPDLVPLLEDESEDVRTKTLASLNKDPPLALASRLIPFLKSDRTEIVWSMEVLVRNLDSRDLVVPLGALLKEGSSFTKMAVLRIFSEWDFPDSIPFARPLLSDPEAGVRGASAFALARLNDGPSIPAIVKMLKDDDPVARAGAIRALREMKIDPGDSIRKLLTDTVRDVRKAALDAVIELKLKSAVPELITLFSDNDLGNAAAPSVMKWDKAAGIRALQKLVAGGAHDTQVQNILGVVECPEVLPMIVGYLEHADPNSRSWALQELGHYKSGIPTDGLAQIMIDLSAMQDISEPVKRLLCKETLDVFRTLLRSGDDFLVEAILREVNADTALPAGDVAPHLKSRYGQVRAAAAACLGKMKAEQFAADIIPLLADKDESVVIQATSALGQLKHAPSVPSLVALLTHPVPEVIHMAVWALAEIGDAPAKAALGKIRPERWSQIDFVAALVQLKSWEVLSRTLPALAPGTRAYCLSSLHPGDETEMELFILSALDDSHEMVRRAALDFAARSKMKAALPRIFMMLKATRDSERIAAAQAAGRIGAATAIDPLKVLLHDPSIPVAQAGIQALARIDRAAFLEPFMGILKSGNRNDLLAQVIEMEWIEIGPHLARRVENGGADWRIVEVLGKLGTREAAPALKTLLAHPDRRTRVTAAGALCSWGIRDGIPEILRAHWQAGFTQYSWGGNWEGFDPERVASLNYLNQFRMPEMWNRLKAIPGPGDCDMAPLLRRLREKENIILEPPMSFEDVGEWDWRVGRIAKPSVIAFLLETDGGVSSFIFEKDLIRWAGPWTGSRFWRRWWIAETKK